MPKGIDVLVEEGFATIDFVDRKLRGQGIQALLEHTPAEIVEKITRSGPRALYRVPEGNARAAGLLDGEAHAGRFPTRKDLHFGQQLAEADPNAHDEGHWHHQQITSKGNAYVNGRDGANGAIQGPLRPNQPTAVAPGRPAAATESAAELQARVKANTPRPASYAPRPTPLRARSTAPKVDQTPKAATVTPVSSGYDDGQPDMDWSRSAMDAYAKDLGIDPSKHSNKEKLLKAIRSAK